MPEHASEGHDRAHSHSEGGPRTAPSVPDHELVRCIGRGAYGEVWLARNVLGTLRAVKVVYRDAFPDARPYEREFEGIQKFEPLSRTHPGLVNVLQIGLNEPAGYFYYVMELADSVSSSEFRVSGSTQAVQSGTQLETRNPELETYIPRTLASDLKAQVRLPFAQCLRTALALADALEHLHRHGLIHRDIKPSNIIFVNGTPKLADIGLVTETGAGKSWVGTEGFMPPEGPGTAQGDIYSLGKVLYEMSTGKDRQRFPEPLTTLADLPDQADWLEFNEVVAKACEGDPKRRYASAADLRADLALLLGGKSVRRLRRMERLTQRARYIVAIGVGALIVVGVIVKSRFDLAQSERRKAQIEAKAAIDKEQVQLRGLIMQDIQNILLQPHGAGWSSKVQAKAQEAARITNDFRLQALAAASLAGVDATELCRLSNFSSMSVAFDSSGQRLLAGGLDGGALLWQTNDAEAKRLDSPGPGIVAFRPDGAPVQLCASNATTFVLWNLAAKRTQQVFHIEGQRLWDEAPKRKGPVLAITPDCSLVAGAATTLDDTGVFAVWDSVSSRPLFHGEQLTTALAFSPDGQFLATGAEDGAVQVFTREGLLLATNNFSHTAVRSLAFQKTVVRSPRSTGPLENWLLAVGEAASTVRLWYLGEAQPPGLLRGCENDVEAVAFNRDGTFLAAASHGGVRLFDVATEKMVLVLPAVDLTFALAFAPSGVGLASGGDNRSKPGAAIFHRLERDRGIQILHGLEGVVEQLRVSRDGRSLVALAQNWRIAVWNRMDGTLQHTMDAPRGVYADNAALALSSNGSLLAVSAGTNAILWNLSTGHEELRRQLPHGLSEQLIFFGTNKLMLFRLERKDALGRPKSQHALGWPSQHCCIRDLLATNRPTPVTSFAEFNWGLNLSAAAPDGRYFVADGMCVKDGATNRSLEFFDGATGSWAGRIPMKLVLDGRGEPYFGLGSFDPTGEFLLCRLAGGLETTLFRASTLRGVRSFGHSLHALAPTATSWAEIGGADLPSLCGLFEASQVKPVLTFAVDLTGAYMKSLQFDLTGRFLAWCNNDGTVSVCDVPTTKRRLAELGLGN